MTAVAELGSGLVFDLPDARQAGEPPEARGLARDQVRLLVAWRDRLELEHAIFSDLPSYLNAGDLLVVNTSRTLPAAVAATGPDGVALDLHFSTRLAADRWVVELRRPALPASVPYREGSVGMSVTLAAGGRADLEARYGTPGRLWLAKVTLSAPFETWLSNHGRPIRYRHVPRDWPLDCYQTVFADRAGRAGRADRADHGDRDDRAGSAEMPSAGRPFSTALVTDLVRQGVGLVPLTLHAGVSSPEAHELPYPEWFRVPPATARSINHTRQGRGRVIAVGTTVVRALETVADECGVVHAGEGWTDIVVTPGRGVRAVDGMITGWHEPAASHLAMLEAVAGRPTLERSYHEALTAGYLWHEFGDSHLILP